MNYNLKMGFRLAGVIGTMTVINNVSTMECMQESFSLPEDTSAVKQAASSASGKSMKPAVFYPDKRRAFKQAAGDSLSADSTMAGDSLIWTDSIYGADDTLGAVFDSLQQNAGDTLITGDSLSLNDTNKVKTPSDSLRQKR